MSLDSNRVMQSNSLDGALTKQDRISGLPKTHGVIAGVKKVSYTLEPVHIYLILFRSIGIIVREICISSHR